MTSSRLPRGRAACAALAAVALFGIAACSASGPGDSSESGVDSMAASGPAPEAAREGAGSRAGDSAARDGLAARGDFDVPAEEMESVADSADPSPTAYAAGTSVAPQAAVGQEPVVDDRSLIRTGSVELRADDVEVAALDVRTLTSQQNGEVAEDRAVTDEDGRAVRAMLVLRVPVAAFEETLAALREQEGTELVDTQSATEDVTTEVIDVDVRVELQRRSIQRISLLLERANSIRDVVAIERELARREADLNSLERRQAYLADQTALSTITVAIAATPEPVALTAAPGEASGPVETSAFASGLAEGWSAFAGATVALLTTVGTLLPFALLLVVVGVPVWLVRRRRSTRDVGSGEATPEPAA